MNVSMVEAPSVYLRLKSNSPLNKRAGQSIVAEHVREMGFYIEDTDVLVRKKVPENPIGNVLVFKPGPDGCPILYKKYGEFELISTVEQ